MFFLVARAAEGYELTFLCLRIVDGQREVRPIRQMLHVMDQGGGAVPAFLPAADTLSPVQVYHLAAYSLPFRPGVK